MSNFRAPLRTLQVDLRSGELDPLLRMRVNEPAQQTSVRLARNVLLQSTGGVTRRPGTVVKQVLALRSRLIEYEYSTTEKYVFAFGDNNLTIYDGFTGDFVQDFTSAQVPWQLDNDFWEMQHTTRGDVMIVAHTQFKPVKIRRTAKNTFVVEYIAFSSDAGTSVINQPYTRYYPATYTMATSNVNLGASCTLTCSPGVFTDAWVGERIRIYNCEIQITAVSKSTTATGIVRQRVEVKLDIAPFRYTEKSAVVEVTHVLHGLKSNATVTISGAAEGGGMPARALNGVRTITVVDEDRYRFTAKDGNDDEHADETGDFGGTNVRVTTTAPTTNWTEQVWSTRRSWPGAIALHENRLWMGGSAGNPTFLAGSAIGEFYDFNVREGLDDESVQGTVATTSRIQYLVSARVLQIFTEQSEAIAETANGAPITPGTLKVVTQTYYGTYRYGMPRIFDGATIFTQKNGKNIRELAYDFNTDSHASVPISVMASHLIAAPIDIACLQGTSTRPEQFAIFAQRRSTVPIFHSIRSEKMAGWTLMVLAQGGGEAVVDSVCCVGAVVWFSILRDGKYYLERWDLNPLSGDPQVWLDSAYIIRSTSTVSRITLPTRYAGKTVHVMSAASLFAGTFVVEGTGQVDLRQPLTGPFVVGFDYGVTVQTNPPDKDMTDGTMTGEKRRILSTNLHMNASVSCAVNGSEILGFEVGHDPSVGRPPFTGKRKVRHFGYGADPVVTITQPDPGPLTILGLVQEVSI